MATRWFPYSAFVMHCGNTGLYYIYVVDLVIWLPYAMQYRRLSVAFSTSCDSTRMHIFLLLHYW